MKSMGGEYSPEARALLEKEGPKYQYGDGCLSDGVLGAWMAAVCGVGEVLDREKVASHLRAVHRYNLKQDLSAHANPQRPTLRLRRGGRPAALHLARGRRAVAALRLLERGLDRHRVPGGLAPDADGHGRGGPRDRPRLPRPLRRPRPQPVQRIRVRPLVRPGHVLLRPAPGPDRRALRRGREGPLPAAPPPRATSAASSPPPPATARSACATASRSSRCARARSTSSGSTTGPAPDRIVVDREDAGS